MERERERVKVGGFIEEGRKRTGRKEPHNNKKKNRKDMLESIKN